MTNKIILLLPLFLSSCLCKTVTFRKEGDFPAYVYIEEPERTEAIYKCKRDPYHQEIFAICHQEIFAIPMVDKDNGIWTFWLGEINKRYRLIVLSEEGELLSETSFTPKEVKRVVISPDSVRKE